MLSALPCTVVKQRALCSLYSSMAIEPSVRDAVILEEVLPLSKSRVGPLSSSVGVSGSSSVIYMNL
jgi:hypothetical protein